jgi:hypothetical protein
MRSSSGSEPVGEADEVAFVDAILTRPRLRDKAPPAFLMAGKMWASSSLVLPAISGCSR